MAKKIAVVGIFLAVVLTAPLPAQSDCSPGGTGDCDGAPCSFSITGSATCPCQGTSCEMSISGTFTCCCNNGCFLVLFIDDAKCATSTTNFGCNQNYNVTCNNVGTGSHSWKVELRDNQEVARATINGNRACP